MQVDENSMAQLHQAGNHPLTTSVTPAIASNKVIRLEASCTARMQEELLMILKIMRDTGKCTTGAEGSFRTSLADRAHGLDWTTCHGMFM